MAVQDVREFFDKVAKDEVLRKKLAEAEKNIGDMNKSELRKLFEEKILPIVKEQGFNFTYDDVLEYKKGLEPKEGQELSDDFLAQAAGGQKIGCWCVGGGDSRGSENNSACGCAMGGFSGSVSSCRCTTGGVTSAKTWACDCVGNGVSTAPLIATWNQN